MFHGSHPPMAMKNSKKKIPPESARAGAEDDLSADNPVIDIRTEQTTSWMISIPETATATAGHMLQSCICHGGTWV